MPNQTTLDKLKLGQKCRVLSFVEVPNNKRRHLLDMGITRGTVIQLKTKAPFGDPVDVIIRGYELCLRKKDMSYVSVEVIE